MKNEFNSKPFPSPRAAEVLKLYLAHIKQGTDAKKLGTFLGSYREFKNGQ